MTSLRKSSTQAILLGSPTINNRPLFYWRPVEMVKGLKFQNKKAAAFGSYSWSGKALSFSQKSSRLVALKWCMKGLGQPGCQVKRCSRSAWL